jgi:hypothetical protein
MSPWYVPTLHDVDETGRKKPDKYLEEAISTQYVNKLFIRDFEQIFRSSGFAYKVHVIPFRSRWAIWARPLSRLPLLREVFHGYVWAVLQKPKRCGALGTVFDDSSTPDADTLEVTST